MTWFTPRRRFFMRKEQNSGKVVKEFLRKSFGNLGFLAFRSSRIEKKGITLRNAMERRFGCCGKVERCRISDEITFSRPTFQLSHPREKRPFCAVEQHIP